MTDVGAYAVKIVFTMGIFEGSVYGFKSPIHIFTVKKSNTYDNRTTFYATPQYPNSPPQIQF